MGKRFEKTEQTKADLREAFWRCYETTPMQKITVAQVCETAGYNRATLYAHYRDLYELLEAVEDDVMAGMVECVGGCLRVLGRGKAALGLAMKDVIVFYERNRRYIYPLLGEQRDPAFTARLKEELKPLWRAYVIGADTGRSDGEIDLMLESAIGGGLSMVSRWLLNPGDVSPTRLAMLVYDVAIRDVSRRASA